MLESMVASFHYSDGPELVTCLGTSGDLPHILE